MPFVHALVVLLLFAASLAQAENYSPYAGDDFPRNVYFGDTHVHSSWSADAGNMGNRRIGPDEVYRFARGEAVLVAKAMSSDGGVAAMQDELSEGAEVRVHELPFENGGVYSVARVRHNTREVRSLAAPPLPQRHARPPR